MNEYGLLDPPETMLESIGSHGLTLEIKLPTFKEGSEKFLNVCKFIRDVFIVYFGDEDTPRYAMGIFIDILINAAEHGNGWDTKKNITVGMWTGENGVLFGVLDEGNFFKEPSVKEGIESRQIFPSTRESGGGVGLGLCNYCASDIKVRKGAIFFTMLLADNIKNS